MTATRSPTLNVVTPSPIAETMPDGSAPGTSGSTAPREYVPFRTDKSKLRLIDTVATFSTISPNAGAGSGTFSSKSCSEPPNARSTTAFIRDLLSACASTSAYECDKSFALTSELASASLLSIFSLRNNENNDCATQLNGGSAMAWLRTTCAAVTWPLAARAPRFCRSDAGRVQ